MARDGTHERMNYAGIPYAGPYESVDQCFISKPFAPDNHDALGPSDYIMVHYEGDNVVPVY